MDRGRPPIHRENNYRPGERYGGRSPPPRRRSPPGGDRAYPVRGGPPHSRGSSPGRPPRYRSRSPYRPRDGPNNFRPRSPPRGPGRRTPPRRFSRSPPPRGPPHRRPSPSTYRPRSPPPRENRYPATGRDDRRDYGGPRNDGPRYPRENNYRPRDGSVSPVRGSGPTSKVASANSSRMPSPHVHPDRLRQNISDSPASRDSPAPYASRSGPPPRRPSPYRSRDRTPPSRPRSPRPSYRDRPPTGPRGSPRYGSPPPRRDRTPPPRPAARDRSPPKGPASDRASYRDRPSAPQRDTQDTPARTTPREEAPSPWGERPPPPGPRVRDDEPRVPPSGPRSSRYDTFSNRESGPPTGPSTPSGPAAMSRGAPYTPRGRGGTPFGRGRGGDTYGATSTFGRGHARGGFGGSVLSETPSRESSGPPTGPRSAGWGESSGTMPATRPPMRGGHSSSATYTRAQRFFNYLGNLPQIVDGGRKLPSNLSSTDEKRLAVLDSERERLHKDMDEKQKKRRALEVEYARAERDATVARLRTDFAEQALERLGGEGSLATAY